MKKLATIKTGFSAYVWLVIMILVIIIIIVLYCIWLIVMFTELSILSENHSFQDQ